MVIFSTAMRRLTIFVRDYYKLSDSLKGYMRRKDDSIYKAYYTRQLFKNYTYNWQVWRLNYIRVYLFS